jgi:cysteine desulfurase
LAKALSSKPQFKMSVKQKRLGLGQLSEKVRLVQLTNRRGKTSYDWKFHLSLSEGCSNMIYFDNSATTKPYSEVIDSFVKVSTEFFGNPSSLHKLGGKSEKLLTQAREQIASLLGVKWNEILFTSGGTEANNLAIKGTALQYRERGKHIITSSIEHPSVYETCQQLASLGFDVTYLPVDNEGRINPSDVEKAIRKDTVLVSIMHVNNEVGTIQPVEEIGRLLKNYPKVLFHVDYVQGCGKVPLDLSSGLIDLCTISAHKIHGLKGVGVLYLREGIRISPLMTGGSQEQKVRSGTENTAGIVAMAKAMRLTMEKRKTELPRIIEIHQFLRQELEKIDGIQINTPTSGHAPHILNVSAIGLRGEVIVHSLAERGIYVSTTSACSSKLQSPSKTLMAMGASKEAAIGTIRVSLSYENTMEEAQQFVESFKQVVENLWKVTRSAK